MKAFVRCFVYVIFVIVLSVDTFVSANFSSKTQAIWAPVGQNASYVFLRTSDTSVTSLMNLGEHQLPQISKLVVRVSASQDNVRGDGKQRLLAAYRLYVNNVEVTQGPGRGNVPLHSLSEKGNAIYDTVEITEQALIGDGKSLVIALQCFYGNGGSNAWAMLELDAFDAESTKIGSTVRTNTHSWFSYNADAVFSPGVPDKCGRVNENIRADVFEPISRWKTAGYIPSASHGWASVESRTPLVEPVKKQTLPLQVHTNQSPVVLKKVGNNHWFFDFGIEAMSGVQLVVPGGQPGLSKNVVITLSEQLNGTDKVLFPQTSGNKYISTCTLAENKLGVDSHIEHHEYPGLWRYGEIKFLDSDGSQTKIKTNIAFTLNRWSVLYPFVESDSSFTSSNSMLDRIWDLCKTTMKMTSLDTFTDSNTRERLPYEADGFITARTRWATQQEYMWPRHSIEMVMNNPTWPTEWKQWTILLVHEQWLMTGDLSIVQNDRNFALLVNNTMLPYIVDSTDLVDWTGKIISHNFSSICHASTGTFPPGVSDGGISCDIVDWHPGWRYRLGYTFSPVNTVVNAFAVKSMELLAELAYAVGRKTAGSMLKVQASRTKASMLKLLYDEESGFFCDGLCSNTPKPGTYHAQHFPFWLGITPDDDIKTVHEYLTKKGMVGSVYTAHSLIYGLYKRASSVDYGQSALELMTQCSNQSWCNMVNNNATTSWEMWGNTEGTHSHPWSTTPGSAVAFGLFGLRPVVPGWKKWKMKIASGKLLYGKIVFPSPHGPIKANFTRDDDKFEVDVVVPYNTTANICLPNRPFSRIHETLGSTSKIFLDGLPYQGKIKGKYLCAEDVVPRLKFVRLLVEYSKKEFGREEEEN